MKTITFYEKMLELAGLTHSKGYIYAVTGSGERYQFKDGERVLILPTTERLRHFNPEKESIFNPLKEDTIRGLSSSFKRYQAALNLKVQLQASALISMVLFVKSSGEIQHQLDFEGQDLLADIKGKVDNKTLEAFTKMIQVAIVKEKRPLFKSHLKNKGTVDGKKYYKVFAGKFCMHDILNDGGIQKKVNLRKMDIESLSSVFDVVMPITNDNGVVQVGSNADFAPEVDALIRGAGMIFSRFNEIIQSFDPIKDELEDAGVYVEPTNLEVIEYFEQNASAMMKESGRLPYPSSKTATPAPVEESASEKQKPVEQPVKASTQPESNTQESTEKDRHGLSPEEALRWLYSSPNAYPPASPYAVPAMPAYPQSQPAMPQSGSQYDRIMRDLAQTGMAPAYAQPTPYGGGYGATPTPPPGNYYGGQPQATPWDNAMAYGQKPYTPW